MGSVGRALLHQTTTATGLANVGWWLLIGIALLVTGSAAWVIFVGVAGFALVWLPLKLHRLGHLLSAAPEPIAPISHDPAMGAIDAMRDEMVGVVRSVERSLRADVDSIRVAREPLPPTPDTELGLLGQTVAAALDPRQTQLLVDIGNVGADITLDLANSLERIDATGSVVSLVTDADNHALSAARISAHPAAHRIDVRLVDGPPSPVIDATIDAANAPLSVAVIDVGADPDGIEDLTRTLARRLRAGGLLVFVNLPAPAEDEDLDEVNELRDRLVGRLGGSSLDLRHLRGPADGAVVWQAPHDP